uniref:Jacalin-type lectin domain-containing protein n=1 Tax=Mycena chlorophos TaxID=658473 RepID=A0ABQ0LIJ0_MYCCL|nr:predicted protein [Mycena chlorophos]
MAPPSAPAPARKVVLIQVPPGGIVGGHREEKYLFNDLQSVYNGGTSPDALLSLGASPIKEITIVWNEVVEGLSVTYRGPNGTGTVIRTHGTSPSCTDHGIEKYTIHINSSETIKEIGTRAGLTRWGTRVCEISFRIFDETKKTFRTAGPFGGDSYQGKPATHVAWSGHFAAFGGYAVDSPQSIAKAKESGKDSIGLYGLVFHEVEFHKKH